MEGLESLKDTKLIQKLVCQIKKETTQEQLQESIGNQEGEIL